MLIATEQQIIRQRLLLRVLSPGLRVATGLVIGCSLTQPVARLLDVGNRIRRSDMNTRIQPRSQGEPGPLERGPAAMASGPENARARHHPQVEDTTRAPVHPQE